MDTDNVHYVEAERSNGAWTRQTAHRHDGTPPGAAFWASLANHMDNENVTYLEGTREAPP